jgi:flagellin-like protein
MFRSLFHDKRGVSEIVASLILVLIVSVAGVALYSYSLSAYSSSSSNFQLQTTQKEEQARERFTILTVWWDTVNQLNTTVLNYGEIELAIDAVYVDGTQVTINEGDGNVIVAGEMVHVKFTLAGLVSGETYEILAVSERGSKDVVHWKA